MKLLQILPIFITAVAAFGPPEEKHFSDDVLDMLPAFIQSIDRLETIDPDRLLRQLGKSDDEFLPIPEEMDIPWDIYNDISPEDLNLDLEENELFEAAKQLLESDKKGTILKVIEEINKFKRFDLREPVDNIKFFVKYIMAPITPVLGGVDDMCMKQGIGLMNHLFIHQSEWALKMLDAIGKSPDGVVSDMTDLCEQAYYWLGTGVQCDFDIPDILRFPQGNSVAYGAPNVCYDVVSSQAEEPNVIDNLVQWDNFTGRYIFGQMVPYPSLDSPLLLCKEHEAANSRKMAAYSPTPRYPGIGAWIDGLLPDNNTLVMGYAYLYLYFLKPKFGTCIPSGCSMDDYVKNAQVMYRSLNATICPQIEHTVDDKNEKSEPDTISYIVIGVYSFIAFVMLLGTLVDVYQRINSKPDLEKSPKEDNLLVKMLKSFSVGINGSRVLNTDVKRGEDFLGCLNGMRVISMLWVILGHVYIGVLFLPVRNQKMIENFLLGKNVGLDKEILLNAYPSVDTFFFMSGLLVSYLSLKELEKGRFNLILFYVHRYIRLTIPLILVIGFASGITYMLGEGPWWFLVRDFGAYACRKYWWANILYVNNMYMPNDLMCIGQTWYIAADMQFFIFSPLVFMPMYYLDKRGMKALAVAWWGVFMTIFTSVLIGLTIDYKLSPEHGIIAVTDGKFDVNDDLYYVAWCRAQPYLVGMLLGYIMFKLKGKPVNIPWFLNIALWGAALAILFGVVFGLHDARNTTTLLTHEYTMGEAVMYQAFSKVAWAVGLAWVTFACVKGYGGIINSFLSWGVFTPLARLVYIVYLVHLDIIGMLFYSMNYAIEITNISMMVYYIGVCFVAFGVGFVGTLTVEMPFANLERLLIGKLLGGDRKPKSQPKETDHIDNKQKMEEDATKAQETEIVEANQHPTK